MGIRAKFVTCLLAVLVPVISISTFTMHVFVPMDQLQNFFIVAFSTSLLAVLVGYTLFLGPLAHRLKNTANAAQRMMEGDLSAHIRDNKSDEIGKLSRTVDKLAMQLERDYRARKNIEEQLLHQATHDELTDLHNRKFANNLIDTLSGPSQPEHSILFLDLNGFKDVNDLYGHAVGDEVLISVAKRLTHSIPNNATLARWGGDEFVVILSNTDRVTASIHADAAHDVFTTPIVSSKGTHHISTSIGISTTNPSKLLNDALLEADALMYEDKRSSKNNPSIHSLANRTLSRALEEQRVELWYQPIIECNSFGIRKLSAADVKIRIRTSEGGIVPIEELLTNINQSWLNTQLYTKVLQACSNSLDRWIDSEIVSKQFKLHLNIYSELTSSEAFLPSLLPCITQNPTNQTKQLVLMLDDLDAVDKNTLRRLNDASVLIAQRHTNDATKTTPLASKVSPSVLVSDVENLSDLDTVDVFKAEGKLIGANLQVNNINTKEQLFRLTAQGIHQFQGNLFDSPLKAVDFISRWGQPSPSSLIPLSEKSFRLRLAG